MVVICCVVLADTRAIKVVGMAVLSDLGFGADRFGIGARAVGLGKKHRHERQHQAKHDSTGTAQSTRRLPSTFKILVPATQLVHAALCLFLRGNYLLRRGDPTPYARSERDLASTPLGGYTTCMMEPHPHAGHPAIATRLKRAEGHLRRIIAMIGEGRPCLDLATQLHAVERAVAEAKRALIHDHIDHCLSGGHAPDMAEIKALTKFL